MKNLTFLEESAGQGVERMNRPEGRQESFFAA
jgi:hypothetical protein